MGRYAVRRVLLIFPTLLIASLLIAAIVRALPGDVVDNLVAGGRGGRSAQTEEVKELTKAKLGLDAPFHVQYIRWIFGWPKTEGDVYRTSDGGDTWNRMGVEVVKPFTHLTFLSPTVGWGVADNMIFGTVDGGRLWSRQHKGDSSLNALVLVDEKNGWAVGDKGAILRTSQGGVRLQTEQNGRISTWLSQNSNTTQRLTDVAILDTNSGWVVGEGGTILHTTDGGTSWLKAVTSSEADLSSVAFADRLTGWAVGEEGTILNTRDGGRTWLPLASGTNKRLNDIAVADVSNLWIVGDKGTLLNSSDGGYTWTPHAVSEDIGQRLTGVAFGANGNGMIVGKNGTILSTSDGGASWLKREIILARREGATTIRGDPITDPINDLSLLVTSRGTVRAWATAVDTHWRWGVVGGNMGERFLFGGASVGGEILRKLGPSIQLMIMSVIIALVFSIPIGILSAIRQDTWGDYLGRTFAISGLAIPTFFLGTMVILIPSFYLGWVPQLIYVPFFEDPKTNLYFYLLPSLVAGFPAMAEVMRMTRSMMLEVLRQDYIRTSWAKGLKERAVVMRHALKNALIPVITLIGLLIPFQLGELIIVEQVFNVPGVAKLLLGAIEDRDYPMIQGVVLFMGTVVVVMNLIVDLLYSWLDPRIRYD